MGTTADDCAVAVPSLTDTPTSGWASIDDLLFCREDTMCADWLLLKLISDARGISGVTAGLSERYRANPKSAYNQVRYQQQGHVQHAYHHDSAV